MNRDMEREEPEARDGVSSAPPPSADGSAAPGSSPTGLEPGHPREFLVGIGASAGGLEGLSALFSKLPTDLGVTYVVVQHLSPTHRSMLAQLIGRETTMKVVEVEDNVAPEPDTVYITPASWNLLYKGRRLHLVEPDRGVMPKPSVNAFFTSLAEEKGEDVLGVILSGTGTDGAAGIRAIKAAGGFTFAQEPASAKYSGMPQAAIDTGSVDWVLPPDKIAQEIAAIARSRGAIRLRSREDTTTATLKALLGRVRQHTRVDFSGYKETTLWRRIERRMAANHVSTLDDYMTLTSQTPAELERLCKDILISVTSFFRDREAFSALRDILNVALQGKSHGDEIRVWIPGCATGEEAYSIAMIISDCLGGRLGDYRVQIFATDLDQDAMTVARNGLYPTSALADLDPALVSRYFSPRGDFHEVSKALREVVLFARQDLVQDPPFLRLDLLSCRNLLIYFQSSLQARILPAFHYALRPGGILFLGKSESILPQLDLFEPVHPDARIFRRRPGPGTSPVHLPTGFTLPRVTRQGASPKERSIEERMLQAAASRYVPSSVLVNTGLDIEYTHGDIGRYLEFAPGRPSHNLLRSIRKELAAEVQTLIFQARQKHASVSGLPRHLTGLEDGRAMRVAVHPLLDEEGEGGSLLICFEQVATSEVRSSSPPPDHAATTIKALEDELATTREQLQVVVQELQTSNEELQALNEELQSSNEELQSTNEELTTSNEELQSTNEELTTVNQELQVKAAELASVNADLEATQASLNESQDRLLAVMNNSTALITLKDLSGRYEFTNPRFEGLFGLRTGGALGKLDDDVLPPSIAEIFREKEVQVLRTRRRVESEDDLAFSDGTRSFLSVRFPLFTVDGAIQAVCTMMNEFTARKTAELRLQETIALKEAILSSAGYSIISTDEDGIVQTLNPAAERLFGYAEEEAAGTLPVVTLHDPDDLVRRGRALPVEGPSPMGFDALVHRARCGAAEESEWSMIGRDGRRFPALLSVTAICDEDKEITGFLFIGRDNSERHEVDRVKNEFISTVSHELRTPLTSIRGALGLLAGGVVGELSPKVRDLVEVARRNSDRLTRLISDILDAEKIASGTFAFQLKPQELAPIIDQAVEASFGTAKEYGVDVKITSNLPGARVNCESDRLTQVMVNLLSNAAKFSPRGSEVQVSAARHGDEIRVSVSDRGRGIPEEFRDRVFEKFAQADSSDARQKGGTGLGLAISKAIIEGHRGKIGFYANPDGGTTFYFDLPPAG